MSESLKNKSVRGLFWNLLDRTSIQIVQLVISIVLARLLVPEDYGIVGLSYIVIAFAGCLLNTGLGSALIQRKEVGELEYSTFFWAEAILRIVVYVAVFFSCPMAAAFYDKPILTPIIRLLSISILLDLFCGVQRVQLARVLDFKTTCWIGVVACTISGTLAVFAAWRGAGLWALVMQNLLSTLIGTMLLIIIAPWRPHLIFSWQRFKEMFNFGYKLLFSGVLDTAYNNIYGMIIGKSFSVATLGLFSKGQHLPQMLVNSVNGPIGNVSFPLLSSLQGDPQKYRAVFRRGLLSSIFFVSPCLFGLAAVAKPLIILLYGDKWLGAVPFMQILAVSFITWPIHTLNLNAINALGRTDIFLKLEVIKKIMGISIVFIALPFGLWVFIWSNLLSSLISIIINTWPMKRLIGYSVLQQLKDMGGILLAGLIMFAGVQLLGMLKIQVYLLLPVQILSGALLYSLAVWIFARATVRENIVLIRNFIHR